MDDTARAVVALAPGRVELQRLPLPEIGPRDLLVRVRLCGICGSDQHLLRSDWGTAFPLILGHELIGTVAEVGEQASVSLAPPIAARPTGPRRWPPPP